MAALFTALTSILGVAACMRYELSIVLPDNDREAANLLVVALCFSVATSLLTIPIVLFGGPHVLQWVRMPELSPYLWLIPIAVWFSGLFSALNYWNTRTKHFTRLSIARITNMTSSTVATLGAGFLGHATGGAMISANVGGQAVATAVLGGQIWYDNGRFLIQNVTWREMWAGLKRHRKFPLYSSWAGLLNTASWMLPTLIIGAFFPPELVGFYALGFRILQMPLSLIGGAISQVFHQRAAESANQGTLAPLVEKLLQWLLIVGLFPMLLLTIVGRELYVVAFGEPWAEAGVYTQILSVWALVWFISTPLSTLFGVTGRQKQGLQWQLAIFISRISSIAIGGWLDSMILAVVLFSATGFVAYAYLLIRILDFSGSNWKNIIGPGVRRSTFAALCLLSIVGITKILEGGAIVVPAMGCLCTAIYVFVMRREIQNL